MGTRSLSHPGKPQEQEAPEPSGLWLLALIHPWLSVRRQLLCGEGAPWGPRPCWASSDRTFSWMIPLCFPG